MMQNSKYQLLIFNIFLFAFCISAADRPVTQHRLDDQQPTSCWQQTIWQSPPVQRAGKILLYTSILGASFYALATEAGINNTPVCQRTVCWGKINEEKCNYSCPAYVDLATVSIAVICAVFAESELAIELKPEIVSLLSRCWHWRHRNDLAAPIEPLENV